MKTLVKMMVLVTMMTAFTALTSREAKSQHVYAEVSFQLFYDQLSPYGFWVNDAHYGRVEDAHMGICHLLCYAFMENPAALSSAR